MKAITKWSEIDPILDMEFRAKLQFTNYKADHRIGTFFEKAFGVKVTRAYVSECVNKIAPDGKHLNWGTRTIILFLGNGHIVDMSNSEWASIDWQKGNNQ